MWKNMYGILPEYLYIAVIGFTFFILCYRLVGSYKNWGLEILKYFYIIVGVTFVSIAPQFMQSTSSIWFVPRALYPFASLFGILILYLNMEEKVGWEKKKLKIQVFLCVYVAGILLAFQLKSFWKIENDRYLINSIDESISLQIVNMIQMYEMENDVEIKKIAIYEDASLNYTYDGIFAFGDTNIKAFFADWSTKEIVDYYLDRNLKLAERDEFIKDEFLQKDWSEFCFGQIQFVGETLILCRY